MAYAITGGAENSLNPTQLSKGTSSVWKGGGFVFYSDNPETVHSVDLADAGCWLLRDSVSGSGFVYSWHSNKCGSPINHALSIYNPNPFEITVSSSNNGLTNSNGGPDSVGWQSYFSGTTSTSINIAAFSYGSLFHQYVPNNYNFGYLGLIRVANSYDNTDAPALFYDIAWDTNSGGAYTFADVNDYDMRRGVGPSFYNTIYFDSMSPSDPNGLAYTICGSVAHDGIFGTDDLPYITDPSGAVSGLLEGGFGQQYAINMIVKNDTPDPRNFHIFIGRPGPYTPFVSLHTFVNFNGVSLSREWQPSGIFKDVISTNILAPGTSETVSFFMVVPGMSATPVILGARTV